MFLLWCVPYDSFELEDDINSIGPSSQLAEGREKLEICAADPTSKPAALMEVKAPPGVLGKKSDMGTPDMLILETNIEKVSPFPFSPSTPVTGSKPGSSSRLVPTKHTENGQLTLVILSSDALIACPIWRPAQLMLGLIYGKLEAVPTSGIFSFGATSSTSSNGLFGTSPAFSATSALTSGNFKNDVSTSSSNVAAPLTSISSTIDATKGSSTTSASSFFGSSAASLLPKEPPAKFGFSMVSPKADSAPATTSTAETTDVKAKSETRATFGNLKCLPFCGSTSSIFGICSSVMSTVTTASVQSQGSVFSSGGESLVCAQTSVGGSGISPVLGSMPPPFGSSTSLPPIAKFPVFGSPPGTTGQVSASPSNNDLVGSTNVVSGIFSFGASSSASSAAGSSSGPTNGTAPLVFTFGASYAAPTSKASVPANSSSTTPGIFSFSGSSSGSSTNAVNISSSITPSMFNFGGNSSSSSTNAVNASATPGIFNVGASSSTSPANADNVSITSDIFNFGASSSAPLTNAGSIVNHSTFNFSATSASSQASSTAGTFGSSWQTPKSTGFTSSFSSSNPSGGFTFGASL
ncbi:hypothetical protein CQW23_28012 [Capsicum baccatum]|uniref:Uncharacterized protein n=1 Tax=Capsicum baccatum TaxID=33114 RepID=A0A2G2VFA2_CAPBA|nr:hypothetical protein CQW23_28012 [Capsicum baccatum]